MNDEAQDVLLVDAYNLIYRAYHGNQNKLVNSSGIPTNAILTVSRMLLKLPEQFNKLTYAVAVFDGGGNFRTELDADYKANRKEMPDDLKIQMPYIKKAFELLGWPIIQAENVEADDVIATLAVRSVSKGFNTYIVSSDKDFRQIVTDNLHVLDTMSDTCYDREKVKEKMGVYPENVAAWLALVGDKADNVKGIEKLGETTVPKLLNKYNNLQGLIDNHHELTGVAGKNLKEAIDNGQLLKYLELVTVKTDVPVEITKKSLTMKEVDSQIWNEFCETLNLKSLLRKTHKM